MSLGAVSAFMVRAVTPRRSLCCRAMPKSPSFRRRSVADEDVQRREVAVQRLPAMQLAEDLEDAGNLAARRRFTPAFAAAAEKRAEIAVARILEHQAVQDRTVLAHQRKGIEDGDRAGMAVEQLPDVRLTQPPVDAAADLDADGGGNGGRACRADGQIHLAEPALAEQLFDPVPEARFRADDRLTRLQQFLRV